MTAIDYTRPVRSPAASEGVDWAFVAVLRARASSRLADEVGRREQISKLAQEELGRSIILDLIETAVADRIDAGMAVWSEPQRKVIAKAVFDALFRLGRLQPLVEDARVENIMIDGFDNVLLELSDGSREIGPQVADSNAELIEFLVFLASRAETSTREFSESNPTMDLRLDDGSRLAASAWVCPRPQVNIRRHRLVQVSLQDLVDLDMLTPTAASFLAAAVRARKSIVVSGAQGAGKTTLVRALCAEIDAWEPIGTFETELELFLHDLHTQHRMVRAWEHRPGSGEIGPSGHRPGEFTLDQALSGSYRYNLARQIVGEVRGKEVWPMIKAMESGTGSISTTHASDAVAAIRKLVTCAMEAGPHITAELATAKLAATIDLVVHITLTTSRAQPGAAAVRTRQVAEIVAVSPGEQTTGYATTHVFTPGKDGAAVPGVLPDEYRELTAHGFDLTTYLNARPRSPEVA
ncbi:CpaF family protein [Pengzhenrongella sicca]|uniref:CpaF family protein n=1 Tax=Pengzhenrongella sicca TaxID=2819238 RepID=A0A8A4ZDL4_9MICO|nr:ATPase, T2SS/T4P/T4SS family [Pengzhenrongella sicca]QTE28577.1 CpaF family protein [Pengzhenrongella sicca]